MPASGVIPVVEVGGFGSFIKEDLGVVLHSDVDGAHIGNHGGGGVGADNPVIAVVGNSQADLFRWYFRQGVLYYTSDHIDRGHGHGRALAVSPLIGHQHGTVGRRTQKGVINSLIQKSPLFSRGLGSQGHGNRIPEQVHDPGGQAHKCGKALPVICQHVFKINVQAAKPLILHGPAQLPYDPLLQFMAAHQGRYQIIIKMPVFPQGGQCQDGTRPPLLRPLYHPRIIAHGRDHFPFQGKAIGKHLQPIQVGQGFLQHLLIDERVRISAGIEQFPSLHRIAVRNIKSLANGQAVWVFYLIVP